MSGKTKNEEDNLVKCKDCGWYWRPDIYPSCQVCLHRQPFVAHRPGPSVHRPAKPCSIPLEERVLNAEERREAEAQERLEGMMRLVSYGTGTTRLFGGVPTDETESELASMFLGLGYEVAYEEDWPGRWARVVALPGT